MLVTGHTGFKGAWLMLLLERFDAEAVGYALPPDTDPSLYALCAPWRGHESILADIRDLDRLGAAMAAFDPEIVLHMAAQSLVRRAYADPVTTFQTNVMGAVNFLQALRRAPSCRAALIVTSDKVYDNQDDGRPFAEQDRLGGRDPYSASKACAEFAAASFAASFPGGPAIATARAGNVVGGGDWAADRLIPDCVRAMQAGKPVMLRYPEATRPWQNVLDVLRGYLIYAQRLHDDPGHVPRALNFGPRDAAPMRVREVAEQLSAGFGLCAEPWLPAMQDKRFEAPALELDASLAETALGWRPLHSGKSAIAATAAWYRAWREGVPARAACEAEIARFPAFAVEAAAV
ncbi:MAG: CDP-glucose 4,6-dehydratase [Hyphomicrobiales bacterium]|nr:CDP-glucose 4,6-dehydratase [Hyphomicrobiales bacterium]